jgi:hypothetical protein
MTMQKSRQWLIPLLVCGLAVTACSKDKDASSGAEALTADSSILRFVPADTPYVVANTAPLPDALYDKFEPKLDALLEAYQVVIREAMKAHGDSVPEGARDEEEFERLAAIADSLSSLFTVSGIRNAGIGRESTFAMYGNGLLPVLRIQLTDGAAFDAAIANVEEEAGRPLETAELGDVSYRYVDIEEARLIVAVIDDQAVITIAPEVFDDEQLGQLLGLKLPANSIADSGELASIAKEYGYTPHYLGLFSMERLANSFIDGPKGLDVDLLALSDEPVPELSDVCQSEIRSMVGVMPRMVMGYTRIDADTINGSFVMELRDDIALGLSMLTAAVPGLGTDQGGLMSFGMGLKPLAAREFYEARLDAMEADPYECEFLQEFQAGVVAGREALNQPVPPIAYDFRGFLAVIDDMDGMDLANGMPPTSVNARILIAMENVEALVAMGSMFSPEIAELNLQADGKPVPLNLPQVPGTLENPHVAMTDNALVISVGDGAESGIAGMLAADADEQPPFMSVAIDAQRYYSLVGDAIAAGDDDEHAPSPEMQEAMQDAMNALSQMYGRMNMNVRFTSRGIEMDGIVTIAD